MPTRDQVLQIIIKRWKEEIGYGYKEKSMDQKKKKKKTSIFLLSSESSLSAMQFSAVEESSHVESLWESKREI